MTTNTSFTRKGFNTITPYLFIKNAAAAVDFYKQVFAAEELTRLIMPNGLIGYAALQIGNSQLMLCDEFPEMNAYGPQALNGTPVTIYLYVADVNLVFDKAIKAGATEIGPVQDQFFGDRTGSFIDPFGHSWHVATHKEAISDEEIQRRFNEMCKK